MLSEAGVNAAVEAAEGHHEKPLRAWEVTALRAAITAYLDNRPSEQVAHPPRISDEAVERVARAICESDYNVWEDSSPRMQSAYLMNARAALAALADGRE